MLVVGISFYMCVCVYICYTTNRDSVFFVFTTPDLKFGVTLIF